MFGPLLIVGQLLMCFKLLFNIKLYRNICSKDKKSTLTKG